MPELCKCPPSANDTTDINGSCTVCGRWRRRPPENAVTQEEQDYWMEYGRTHPMSEPQLRSLLTKTVDKIRQSAAQRGDSETLDHLQGKSTSQIVDEIVKNRNPHVTV